MKQRLNTTGSEKKFAMHYLSRWLPLLVMVVSLVVTFKLWTDAEQGALIKLQSVFDYRALNTLNPIEQRLKTYEQVLQGVQGLYASSKSVERDEFYQYLNSQHLQENYPGIQSVNFVRFLPATQKAQYIDAIRKEGFQEFNIYPDGTREIYCPLTYVEPFSKTNESTLGLDTCADERRSVAKNQARDTGMLALTGKTILSIESPSSSQAGVVMVAPIYTNGMPVKSVAERRASIYGWITATFRMNDLMSEIVNQTQTGLDVEVYDGNVMSEQTLLFDADGVRGFSRKSDLQLNVTKRILIANRTWTIAFYPLPAFLLQLDKEKPRIIAYSGVGLSLLLALLTWLLVQGRERALNAAASMNQSLIASEERLKEAQRTSQLGSWELNLITKELIWSDEIFELFEIDKNLFSATYEGFLNAIHPDDVDAVNQAYLKSLETREPYEITHRLLMTDGRVKWVNERCTTHFDIQGEPTRSVGTIQDITERVLREQEQRASESQLQAFYELDLVGLTITSSEKGWIRINGYLCNMLEYSEQELRGMTWAQLTHPEDLEADVALFNRLLVNEIDGYSLEKRFISRTGKIIPTNLVVRCARKGNGEVDYVMAMVEDLTERKAAEAKIRKTEGHLTTILNSLDEVIWTASAPDFNLHHVSAATQKLYGVSQQAFMDDPELWFKVIHPDDKLHVQKITNQIFAEGKTEIEYRIVRGDGQERWLSDRMYVIYDDNGAPTELVGIAYDITDRKLIDDAIRKSEQQAKKALEELQGQKFALDKHAIVAVADVKGRITYANSKFCEVSGYTLDELIGQDHSILNSGYHPKGFFKEMYRTVVSGKPWHKEVCNRAKDGHLYWVDTTIAPFMSDDGKLQSYISIRTDITQRKLAEEESNYLAFFDPLTQLPNRRLLLDRLKQALAGSARSGKRGALLFIDLDHFKTLNDTLGHDFGDLLLQQVATRLTSCVREGDTVARLGGDEFVMLLEDLSADAIEAAAYVEAIAEKIMLSLNQTYQLDTHEYKNTPSIGATLFNGDVKNADKDELLKQADIAMYQAKKSGRNVFRFFDPKMQELITIRVDLEHELRLALEQQQFQLHYQIQVDSTGQCLGAEALIRWSHPKRGMVSPFHFIPLAEETGLILPIGQWVLDTACAQLKIWLQDEITRNLILAVNVSAKQFLQVDFVQQVQATIQRHNIDPTRLKLELTESMLVENIKDIITIMNSLKILGVRFSLDDFGTGYSSLQYLKMLPLNQLKIDQSFVRDIATDNSDRAIVLTIITMAKSLGLDVIAEGVETEEQLQFLKDNGCQHYQGYLFSKPVPIDAFEALLRTS